MYIVYIEQNRMLYYVIVIHFDYLKGINEYADSHADYDRPIYNI
jgi:hypothetical protein